MRRFVPVTFALVLAVSAQPAAAQAAGALGFARDPHYNGGKVVFSFRGNLWQVNEDGSNARQLTRADARDIKPRFSPDGQWIAFTSSLAGNPDVYIMPANGGEPKRLTWHSGNDEVQYWAPDGRRILFSSARGPGGTSRSTLAGSLRTIRRTATSSSRRGRWSDRSTSWSRSSQRT